MQASRFMVSCSQVYHTVNMQNLTGLQKLVTINDKNPCYQKEMRYLTIKHHTLVSKKE